MEIEGWKYYNHAAIPTTAPHENPDLSPVEDGSIWKIDGRTPLLARWTTDFDCGYETNWWYVIKEGPFDLEELPSKERKSIRQALKKSYAKKINFEDYVDDLYFCYMSAHEKYKNADNKTTKESFVPATKDTIEYWGAFDFESDKLIGYMTVLPYNAYAEIQSAKFDPDYFKQQASDTLYFTVLDYYLNECKKKYICSGSRNVNHKTGTQEYKIRRFGYKKAYCNLNVKYNPKVKIMVKVLYFFRKFLRKLDNITLFHQINGVLLMEEIVRNNK